MHTEAYEFVKRFATDEPITIIEFGSRNVNGSIRDLFPNAVYTGVDKSQGDGVDVVCDASEFIGTADLVVCCEVLEHAENWRDILNNAYDCLPTGGRFLMTCAGIGREVHSGIDGEHRLLPGEWYENRSANDIEEALFLTGFRQTNVMTNGHDVYAMASK